MLWRGSFFFLLFKKGKDIFYGLVSTKEDKKVSFFSFFLCIKNNVYLCNLYNSEEVLTNNEIE